MISLFYFLIKFELVIIKLKLSWKSSSIINLSEVTLKKRVVFTAILSSLILSHNVFANDSGVKLKKKCAKEYPLVDGETDQSLLGIYAQICDKKNNGNKNNLLIQAAQRYQQLGENLKALQLVNDLHNQNIQSTALTDVQFMAGSKIANSAIIQMRTKELRYLTSEQTYPVAKELTDSINITKPAPVLTNAIALSDDEKPSTKSIKRKYKSVPVTVYKNVTKPKAKPKVKAVAIKPVKTTPVVHTAPASSGGNNPFATLKK